MLILLVLQCVFTMNTVTRTFSGVRCPQRGAPRLRQGALQLRGGYCSAGSSRYGNRGESGCCCCTALPCNFDSARESTLRAENFALRTDTKGKDRARRRQCGADVLGRLSLVWLWCGGHTQVGRYLGSTRNGVTDPWGDLELVVYNEAVQSRGTGPGIHNSQNPEYPHRTLHTSDRS